MDTRLRATDLAKSFGGVQALAGVTFAVAPGEILGLIGPNGSGKTTAINVLTGVIPATSGSVTLGESDLTGFSPHRIARAGVVRTFQNLRLFGDLSVLDNVRVAQTARCRSCLTRFSAIGTRAERRLTDRAMAILRQLSLSEHAHRSASALSYGERKRVEIARALALDPRVLLLDEPAAGMNPVEIDGLKDVIRAIRADGTGVLLIEHHMKLVMNVCDRIAVLNFGRKIAEGAPADVASDPAVVDAYLGKTD